MEKAEQWSVSLGSVFIMLVVLVVWQAVVPAYAGGKSIPKGLVWSHGTVPIACAV